MFIRLVLAALTSMAVPFAASAQSASDLQGAWSLVSSVLERDGKAVDQFGAGAKGMMILNADGRFILTIIAGDLPKFASNNRASGTPEENKAVVAGSIAMLGTYAYDATNRTLTLRTESATFPNWNGTEQRRSLIGFDGTELKYATAQASGGGRATVTWRRVN
jgi:lipocalin-like protein